MTEKNRQVTKNSWDIVQVEYQAAMEQYRHYTVLRRQDMAFVTTVQVAILTIIGAKAQSLDFSSFLLSLMAFFVLLLGINSELRLATYMSGYKQRAKDIEEENRLNIVTGASKRVEQMEKNMFNITNRKIFPLYYSVFALIWIAVWLTNLY